MVESVVISEKVDAEARDAFPLAVCSEAATGFPPARRRRGEEAHAASAAWDDMLGGGADGDVAHRVGVVSVVGNMAKDGGLLAAVNGRIVARVGTDRSEHGGVRRAEVERGPDRRRLAALCCRGIRHLG